MICSGLKCSCTWDVHCAESVGGTPWHNLHMCGQGMYTLLQALGRPTASGLPQGGERRKLCPDVQKTIQERDHSTTTLQWRGQTRRSSSGKKKPVMPAERNCVPAAVNPSKVWSTTSNAMIANEANNICENGPTLQSERTALAISSATAMGGAFCQCTWPADVRPGRR